MALLSQESRAPGPSLSFSGREGLGSTVVGWWSGGSFWYTGVKTGHVLQYGWWQRMVRVPLPLFAFVQLKVSSCCSLVKGKAQGSFIYYTHADLGKYCSLCTGKLFQHNCEAEQDVSPTQLSAKSGIPSQPLLTRWDGESEALSAQRRGC